MSILLEFFNGIFQVNFFRFNKFTINSFSFFCKFFSYFISNFSSFLSSSFLVLIFLDCFFFYNISQVSFKLRGFKIVLKIFTSKVFKNFFIMQQIFVKIKSCIKNRIRSFIKLVNMLFLSKVNAFRNFQWLKTFFIFK